MTENWSYQVISPPLLFLTSRVVGDLRPPQRYATRLIHLPLSCIAENIGQETARKLHTEVCFSAAAYESPVGVSAGACLEASSTSAKRLSASLCRRLHVVTLTPPCSNDSTSRRPQFITGNERTPTRQPRRLSLKGAYLYFSPLGRPGAFVGDYASLFRILRRRPVNASSSSSFIHPSCAYHQQRGLNFFFASCVDSVYPTHRCPRNRRISAPS